MSDFNSLPVAPEFVETLSEDAVYTALDCLQAANAPDYLVDLVRSIGDMAYYLQECHRNPQKLVGDPRYRFEIETVVITAINAIAKSGGTFHGRYSYSLPREILHPELQPTIQPTKSESES